MSLLLDTHHVYAVAGAPVRTSAKERAFLNWNRAVLTASVLSLWEIKLKWNARHRSGERKGPAEPEAVRAVLEQLGVPLLPLFALPVCKQLDPPLAHGDPFDEMLLLQAEAEGARLLTRDKNLAGHRLALTV
ncbi:MAG: type II toxin-antitoxin system VapC family toxin [Oceanicaulis sp.]